MGVNSSDALAVAVSRPHGYISDMAAALNIFVPGIEWKIESVQVATDEPDRIIVIIRDEFKPLMAAQKERVKSEILKFRTTLVSFRFGSDHAP